MFFLPNDILYKIVDQLDIVSFIRLNSTCKGMQENVGLSRRITDNPIQYLNKIDGTCKKYKNLNTMIDDIFDEITDNDNICEENMTSLFKEYTTIQDQNNYTLQIHRNVKYSKNKCYYNYQFTIRKLNKQKYMQFQFMFDPIHETYIAMRHVSIDFNVPLLFLFIGCKVLFKIYGYNDVKSFKHLPEWFSHILLHKKFSGIMLKDIVGGSVII